MYIQVEKVNNEYQVTPNVIPVGTSIAYAWEMDGYTTYFNFSIAPEDKAAYNASYELTIIDMHGGGACLAPYPTNQLTTETYTKVDDSTFEIEVEPGWTRYAQRSNPENDKILWEANN